MHNNILYRAQSVPPMSERCRARTPANSEGGFSQRRGTASPFIMVQSALLERQDAI
jgi:hypothetical protein